MSKFIFQFLFIIIFQSQLAMSAQKLKLESLEFFAPANLSAFNVSGIAKTLDGEAVQDAKGTIQVKATVPVDSLTTRMTMRDTHMKKRVFQTKEGKTPDLVLTGSIAACPLKTPSAQCTFTGDLEIQGIKKPLSLNVVVNQTGGLSVAECEGTVKLSDYGIPQPEQLGVKVANEVKLKVKVALQ